MSLRKELNFSVTSTAHRGRQRAASLLLPLQVSVGLEKNIFWVVHVDNGAELVFLCPVKGFSLHSFCIFKDPLGGWEPVHGSLCCLLITILGELPPMIGSLGVFSLAAELSGAGRNPGFFSSWKGEEGKEKCSGFPGSPTARACLTPNLFLWSFHNEKNAEALEVFFIWRVPGVHFVSNETC